MLFFLTRTIAELLQKFQLPFYKKSNEILDQPEINKSHCYERAVYIQSLVGEIC